MPGTDLSFFASLREAYEASRRVRTPQDLQRVLEGVASLVSDSLGWQSVAINLHRRAWDDFQVTVVHGRDEAREVLLGNTNTWRQFAPLFHERHAMRGAHFIPEEHQVADDMVAYIPAIAPSDAADAWRAEDQLLVLMRGSDGEVAGILSVDEPVSGRRPGPEEIDALVAVANAAGAALQQAREAVAEDQHQIALKQLLTVSTRIADARSDTDVLEAVCSGIRDALGFERVVIELSDESGALVPAASVGWESLPDVPVSMERFARIMQPAYEEHGCYLLDHLDALRILELPDAPYVSQRNGRGPWAWSRHWLCVPLRDPSGAIAGFIWVDEPSDRLLPDTQRLQALRLFADQAQAALEAARHYEQALYMAAHDSLTGLANRVTLLERLRHALLRARRNSSTVAVLFVDIDRFKSVNDTHGHEAGDEVLRAVASRIDDHLRPGDTVARLGGDEFVVLCEDVRGQDDALEVARRIRARLSQPIPVGNASISLTASVGIALPGPGDEDAQELLRFADVAMYRAKAAGRDAEELASAALREGASARAQLERALSGALERKEIHLHWQPIVSAETGRVLRVEALMRWIHPGLGHVSPLEFIPLAEDNGSIVQLGRWALDRACAQWAQWRAELGDSAPAIAVNLSPRQLRDNQLLEQVAWLISEHAMPKDALTVEITEGALLDATPATIQTLSGLRRLGCSIELDDFGTGFSSLSSLAEFNVDGLKIDRSFISGHTRDGRAAAIAQAVLAMAAALGMRATAEGVETLEQLEWLRSRGCPEAQGYLFSRPLDAEAITELLAAAAPLLPLEPAAASAP
ncbi:MAG: diguanylate cyclase/phosphodiesterase with sensor [Solirubrobacterales bacterium]|nr:diguanylate cyclase/phosphodiesterase with sensor [Solirubrobacterales bacterium]